MTGLEVVALIEAALLLSARLSSAIVRANAELERARAAGADTPIDPEAIRPLLEALNVRDAELSKRAHELLAEIEGGTSR